MYPYFTLCSYVLQLVFYSPGVFGESVSVMEGHYGDSVTLKTNVTELHGDEDITWKYGAEKSLIVKISNEKQIFSTFDILDGRFRDRLKVDHQTGSLTITNITTQHAGIYEQQKRGAKLSSKTFNVSVYGVFGAETNEIQSVSVMEGDSVTLKTNVTELHEDDEIAWKYGAEKSLIAKIFSISDDCPDGRFRDKLKLDNQTGSLTITNITTQHTGAYQLQISGVKLSSKTFSVSVFGEWRSLFFKLSSYDLIKTLILIVLSKCVFEL
uniref:Immunoglobulin domain-containing protein n=1 Tax=Sinocyclocheilus grahami TaxID=75366 RepID=A0A672LXC9_SINGR